MPAARVPREDLAVKGPALAAAAWVAPAAVVEDARAVCLVAVAAVAAEVLAAAAAEEAEAAAGSGWLPFTQNDVYCHGGEDTAFMTNPALREDWIMLLFKKNREKQRVFRMGLAIGLMVSLISIWFCGSASAFRGGLLYLAK